MSKIMVADDDPAILHSLHMLLDDEGYDVVTTVDGNTVKKIDVDLPDLILLDIWMSGLDGREVCRHLKSRSSTKSIPVILMSANRDTKQIALESGANDFILKPFDVEDMLNKIEKNLS